MENGKPRKTNAKKLCNVVFVVPGTVAGKHCLNHYEIWLNKKKQEIVLWVLLTPQYTNSQTYIFYINTIISIIDRINDTQLETNKLDWNKTSTEILYNLIPGTSYILSVIGKGCKLNDTQETEQVRVNTHTIQFATIQLEESEESGNFTIFIDIRQKV